MNKEIRRLMEARGFTFDQAERVGVLERTHGLPRTVGVRVVSGKITLEQAVK